MNMKLSFIYEGGSRREFLVEKFALLDGGFYLWSKEDLGEEFPRVNMGSSGEPYELNPMKLRILGFEIGQN